MKEILKIIGLVALLLIVLTAYALGLWFLVATMLNSPKQWEQIVCLIVWTLFIIYATLLVVWLIRNWKEIK